MRQAEHPPLSNRACLPACRDGPETFDVPDMDLGLPGMAGFFGGEALPHPDLPDDLLPVPSGAWAVGGWWGVEKGGASSSPWLQSACSSPPSALPQA